MTLYILQNIFLIPFSKKNSHLERLKKKRVKTLATKNFKHVFLETIFFKIAATISQDLLNRLISNLVCTYLPLVHMSLSEPKLNENLLFLIFDPSKKINT
jgi:hypothetical protein